MMDIVVYVDDHDSAFFRRPSLVARFLHEHMSVDEVRSVVVIERASGLTANYHDADDGVWSAGPSLDTTGSPPATLRIED